MKPSVVIPGLTRDPPLLSIGTKAGGPRLKTGVSVWEIGEC